MPSVVWYPQTGPQAALLESSADDVLYGGSRGGGKSDGLIGDWAKHAETYGNGARGILFRRSYPELEALISRAQEILCASGVEFKQSRSTFVHPNGARLKCRYLAKDGDADVYQGHSYTWIGCDELTHWPTTVGVDKLRATLRSATGVPTRFRGTANPGGPGHNWVKARYIDPAAPWQEHTVSVPGLRGEVATLRRLFIPATLDDNRILLDNDPTYWSRVVTAAAGQEWLLKAWRYGLWDIVAGGYFDDLWWPDSHVIEPFDIPASWRIDRAFDWGSSSPFSVGWYAESDGTTAPNGWTPPRGSVIRIAEWYGWNGQPNQGLRMLARDIATGIRQLERDWGLEGRVKAGPADSAIFTVENGRSIAKDMAKAGVRWHKANNKPGSRRVGWQTCRAMLSSAREERPEQAAFYVFSNCRQFIRTVPVLQRDDRNVDDVNTDSEDHIADEWRYRLNARRMGATNVKHRV